MLRFADWQLLGPDYVSRSAAMEADEGMKKALSEWRASSGCPKIKV